jgi:hypothetical protein
MATDSIHKSLPVYSYDGLPTEDEFERRDFAKRVANTILDQPLGPCMVVSIVGPWGSGKTTVLEYVKAEIASRTKAEKTCFVAPFNPWRFAGEDLLLYQLFESLVTAIDPNLEILTEWQQLREKVSKVSATMTKTISAVADFKYPGSGGILSGVLSAILPGEFKAKLEDIRIQTADHLARAKLRVVVLLDDVDRLEVDDLLLLLRSVKLTADLPNTTFVIAMDEEHVSRVIGQRIDRSQKTGRAYIEKIINVRIGLPAIPDHVLSDYTLGLVDGVIKREEGFLTSNDVSRVRAIFLKLHAPFVRTPRTAKAIQNACSFALGLLPKEVNAGDVFLLEATRLLHPLLHETIKDVVPLFKVGSLERMLERHDYKSDEAEKRRKNGWERLLKSFKHIDSQLEDCRRALKLWFPQLDDNVSSELNLEAWASAKRICSPDYFWRYFSGAVQKNDVRDEIVSLWVSSALADNSEIVGTLVEHLKKSYGRAFLAKMETACASKDTNYEKVLFALCKASGQLETTDADNLRGSIRQRASQVFARIFSICRPARELEDLGVRLLQSTGDLEWSFEWTDNVPSETINTSTHKQDGGKQNISKIDRELALQSLAAYESGKVPDSNKMICNMVWAISRNAHCKGFKGKIQKLVKMLPSFGLHLAASGCAFSPSQQSSETCWRWERQTSLERVKSVVDLSVLKTALNRSLRGKRQSLKTGNDSRYQTLEEVGFECLKEIVAISAKK